MKERIIQLLSRKTSSLNLIPEIDGFRFFAIGTVLLFHLNTHLKRVMLSNGPSDYFFGSWVDNVASRGGIGVNVFFAISGFILALPFAKQRLFDAKPINLGSYYVRRLTRLEPPYVISLIIFLFVHVWILHENMSNILPNFLASLFYVHNLVYNEWSKINPVAWSLEVEVQFYLLAPFLAAFFSIRNPVWRRVILISVIALSILHYNLNYAMIEALHLRKSLFMHLHQFLIGFLFADFFLTDWKETLKLKSYYFDLIGLMSLAALLIFNAPFSITDDLLFVICLFIAFICLFRGRLINHFFTNTWIVIIGGMCYSIYLLHYALIAFLAERIQFLFTESWGYAANYFLQLIIIIPLVLIVSSVYFALIERPCMDKDWPQRLWVRITSVFTH